MNKSLPIKWKFNINGLLKLSLITLALSLCVGAYTQANAQSSNEEVEVILVPPQEAYYIEDKTQVPLSDNDSGFQQRKTWGDNNSPTHMPNGSENRENYENRTNSVPRTYNSPQDANVAEPNRNF